MYSAFKIFGWLRNLGIFEVLGVKFVWLQNWGGQTNIFERTVFDEALISVWENAFFYLNSFDWEIGLDWNISRKLAK